MEERYRAGELAPRAGDYEVLARGGEHTGVYRRGLKGRPLPPTPAWRAALRVRGQAIAAAVKRRCPRR